MPTQEYIYQDRVVAFVDILGFQQKLKEFESDARAGRSEHNSHTQGLILPVYRIPPGRKRKISSYGRDKVFMFAILKGT
jgi:hypothetical protein